MDLKSVSPQQPLTQSDSSRSNSDKGPINVEQGFSKVLDQQASVVQAKILQTSTRHIGHSTYPSEREAVAIGTISKKLPTVSHLLKRTRHYAKDCWKIIYTTENKQKNFRNITAGTQIFLDPKSKELFWENPGSKQDPVPKPKIIATKAQAPSNLQPLVNNLKTPHNLDEAVKPYMGNSYQQTDCYSLILKGLKNLGINYLGKNGLRSQLINMAESTGRRRNAFFNGEGIIEASGRKVYAKSISHVSNPDQEAQKVFDDLKPLLTKGDILAFSIHTKGHTGIVSQSDDSWTFLNSGKLDHSVHSQHPRKGVGEENLRKELSNWFRLAANRKESLLITLGRLEDEKIAAYMESTPKQSS